MIDTSHVLIAAIKWKHARSKDPLSWQELAQAEYELVEAVKLIEESVMTNNT